MEVEDLKGNLHKLIGSLVEIAHSQPGKTIKLELGIGHIKISPANNDNERNIIFASN